MDRANRPVRFLAQIAELASSEVQKAIGEHRYNAIKKTDEHPMFITLRVGYEGVSKGSLTIGNVVKVTPKRWYRPAVEELANRMNFGGPGLFAGSHADRDQAGRQRHGDVLAGFVRDNVRGEAEAVGIAYVQNADTRTKIQDGKYDVCSVEGDVVIAGLDGDEPYIDAVQQVSGVCLASSEDQAPGFELAGVEAVINELLHGGIDEMADKPTGKPSANYSRNELAEDPTVKDLINEARENTYKDYQKQKERSEALEAEVKTLRETNVKLEGDLKSAGVTKNAGRITKELQAQVGALKLTAKEKELIQTRLSSAVQVDDANATDEVIKQAVEKAVKSEETYAMDMRKIYGKPPEAGASGKSEEDGDAGNKEDAGKGSDDDDPFLKANPLASAKA